MAQKRMFSNLVINSDSFLEMPDSSQNLYFHLSMAADDDGFVDNWKSIMRMTGKKDDDLKILIAKSFVLPFETGVLVIRHWRLNNYIQKDRYKETIHKAEKSLLSMDENNVYNVYTDCIHSIDKIRLDKISIDKKENIKRKKFVEPTLDDIQNYIKEKQLNVDGKQFYDYFTEGEWKDSKGNQVKNWKQKLLTWNKYAAKVKDYNKYEQRQYKDLNSLYANLD